MTDRWLEMDLTWFDPTQPLDPQLETLLTRTAPLLYGIEGEYGIFFNIGWLIDFITEWTGDPDQNIPTRSRRTARWATKTYADLQSFIAKLRQQASRSNLPHLKIGVLFVEWAHVVWPPELKIYDFDSDWYARHPELYAPPKSFIGMPDLHPIKRLKADHYPYAAFPNGIQENTYFPDFFGAQWGHLADFLDLDAIHLRDGFTGPMIYTRNGPYGTSAPADPQTVAAFSQAVRDLYKAVKSANPAKLVFGYSSAISPVADWRVGCVDFEALVADGYIDGWIEQTWGGAWQDWWHQLWKGWTFQTANLLTRGAMIAKANQQREKPCKFYNLIETWDGWEPWDTLHQVPHKLRWAMWAFTHAAVITPDGVKVPDGSYISWMNNGNMELLSEADVRYIAENLTQAQKNAISLEKVYGATLVYNRAMMEWLSENHPDWNAAEWIDDQAAMLMKWGTPILSATRAEWLDSPQNTLILQTPGNLSAAQKETLESLGSPVLATGRADVFDPEIQHKLGIQPEGEVLEAEFWVASGEYAPAYDRPYIPDHAKITIADDVTVHYQTSETPLLTQRSTWLYWQPPDWSEPFNPFVPKYQLGSTFPHYRVATLLHELAKENGLSHLGNLERPQTVAFHLWKSAGEIYVLLGNLETGEFGDSRTPRTLSLHFSRKQLELGEGRYFLVRVDTAGEKIEPTHANADWLVYRAVIPPEQSAVYVLRV